MYNANNFSVPSSSSTEVLRSLQRDAEKDRSWFQRYFNPTKEELLERMSKPDLVERLVIEHPWIVLGPASLMMQPLKTAGAIALKRVAPLFLAAAYEVGNIYKNLINYAKGGKDAVTKGSSGGGERVTPTHSGQRTFIEDKLKSKEWTKISGKMLYEDKSGIRYVPTKEKFEFEVGQKISGKWTHIGILRGEGREAGRVLGGKFAKGLSCGKYFE